MAFLGGNTTVTLIDGCGSLEGLTATFEVSEDLVTVGNSGFGLQLNCFPTADQAFQDQTLNWFQFGFVVGSAAGYEPGNDQNIGWFVEYWNTNAPVDWPTGYTPEPPGTIPDRPVIPDDETFTTFGPAPNNQILARSILQMQLVTNASGGITEVLFSYTDPTGKVYSANYTFASGAVFQIYGAQLVLVGPFNAMPVSFSSGAGTFTLSVSSGALSVEPAGSTCSGVGEPGTAEDSNSIYGPFSPASGASVSQSVTVIPMTMSFDFEQTTFSLDEVRQAPFWNPAYYLSVTGFPNVALGFNKPSDLNNAGASPAPTIIVSIDASQNPALSDSQIATISANLPVVNRLTPPILAVDGTLTTNYQTFLYPYRVTFPNLDAFGALDAEETAVLTLEAKLTVPVPTGGNTNTQVITMVGRDLRPRSLAQSGRGQPVSRRLAPGPWASSPTPRRRGTNGKARGMSAKASPALTISRPKDAAWSGLSAAMWSLICSRSISAGRVQTTLTISAHLRHSSAPKARSSARRSSRHHRLRRRAR